MLYGDTRGGSDMIATLVMEALGQCLNFYICSLYRYTLSVCKIRIKSTHHFLAWMVRVLSQQMTMKNTVVNVWNNNLLAGILLIAFFPFISPFIDKGLLWPARQSWTNLLSYSCMYPCFYKHFMYSLVMLSALQIRVKQW